jgi:hypothetical protein
LPARSWCWSGSAARRTGRGWDERLPAPPGTGFGWHRDNLQGMTVQPNGWRDDWPSFYVERRTTASGTSSAGGASAPGMPHQHARYARWEERGLLSVVTTPYPDRSVHPVGMMRSPGSPVRLGWLARQVATCSDHRACA